MIAVNCLNQILKSKSNIWSSEDWIRRPATASKIISSLGGQVDLRGRNSFYKDCIFDNKTWLNNACVNILNSLRTYEFSFWPPRLWMTSEGNSNFSKWNQSYHETFPKHRVAPLLQIISCVLERILERIWRNGETMLECSWLQIWKR